MVDLLAEGLLDACSMMSLSTITSTNTPYHYPFEESGPINIQKSDVCEREVYNENGCLERKSKDGSFWLDL